MPALDYLIITLSLVIESFFITYLVTVLVGLINRNSCNKGIKKFLILWLVMFIGFLINKVIHIGFPNFKGLKPFVFALFTSLGCFFEYNTKPYKSAIIGILCLILSAVIEIIVALVLSELNIKPEDIITGTLTSGIYACLIAAFEALIGAILQLFSKSLATVENKLKYFIPHFIAIIICLLPTMVLLMLNDFKYSKMFIIVNVSQLLTITLVSLFSLKFVAKHEDTELQLANTITYNETLKKVNEGVRGFKHDMGNIVQAILGYIAINDAEGAKQYCKNLVIGFNDINVLSILSPKVIDDPAIYGIVVNKILMAREKNMSLELDISTSITEINFPKFELSRILGILLDNAIEAGENTDDKKLVVNIHHDYNMNADIIIISNSVNDINIDTKQIFDKNYSTKENPSGFGLYEVAKFLNKEPQSNILTTINKKNKLFTQKITIYR